MIALWRIGSRASNHGISSSPTFSHQAEGVLETLDNRKAVTGLNPVTAFSENSERRP
jgi:hypothetical protein